MSDSASAFSLSAFCPPDSFNGDGELKTEEESEATDRSYSQDLPRLDIDIPMEELLILFGASRLHTGSDKKGKRRNTSVDAHGVPAFSPSVGSPFPSFDPSEFTVSEMLSTFTDPTVMEMQTDIPGSMAEQAKSAWWTFMAEMDGLDATQTRIDAQQP